MTDLNNMRVEYTAEELDRVALDKNPYVQFDAWLQDAIAAQEHEPNAMVLATVNAKGQASMRMVLLKYFDEHGFVFFTNYNSHKAQDLRENPNAALLFWWPNCQREIRIEGTVTQLDGAHSDQYFAKRERLAQVASWASRQSATIASRKELLERYESVLAHYKDVVEIPRPEHWGGYILTPTRYELWQGRPHRLHDRFVYLQTGKKGEWRLQRLSP